MKKFVSTAIASFVLALGVTACGHSAAATKHPTRPTATQVHPCVQSDFYMQCALRNVGMTRELGNFQPFASGLTYGIDFGWGTVGAGSAQAMGARFGISYLSYDYSKNWTRSLVNAYHTRGLATAVVWETSAARALGGWQAGFNDAREAASQAAYLGEPSSRPIYFAVDFDTTGYGCAICGYFRGADAAIGLRRVGTYGGLPTIAILNGAGLVSWNWQTSAWSRGIWASPPPNLEQYAYTNNYDWNRAMTRDYGQWPIGPQPRPRPRPVDRHHYAWFANSRFSSPFGPLHERGVVLRYDGARKHCKAGGHCGRFTKYLNHVLRPELKWLADRAWYIAHRDRDLGEFILAPRWNVNHLGWRYQQLIKRAHGQRLA